ncbi:L-rhamnose mutarotase [Mucilaginibacter sp. AW1-7]|uniref:L-rhamnose mutarotase n=1 Tax=Mucilaginibacter sp. AW1-7 TaxID=3349874 RepID=UPI003F73418C
MRALIIHINRKSLGLMMVLVLLLKTADARVIGNPYAAVEITAPVGKTIDHRPLLSLIKKQNLPFSSIYEWSNHLVIYGKNLNINKLYNLTKGLYPGLTIRTYRHPFYAFNKQQCCVNSVIAPEWDNIILTANLVKDPKLQQEYLNYHATQFQKWPEVSKGFCNANFQQLLVFKNGRQLMLVISIPKGESLDKLNPKTTENNPRVNEWNKLMKKYQEGIPGTKPGEVWVFFKPLKIQ